MEMQDGDCLDHFSELVSETQQLHLLKYIEEISAHFSTPLREISGHGCTQLFNVDAQRTLIEDGNGTHSPKNELLSLCLQFVRVCNEVAVVAYGQTEKNENFGDVRLGLIEVVAYEVNGSTPPHVDCVAGKVCVVSLGAECIFEWTWPTNSNNEEKRLVLRSGDVCRFAGDASAGLRHRVVKVSGKETVPNHLADELQGRFVRYIVQMRKAHDIADVCKTVDSRMLSNGVIPIPDLATRLTVNFGTVSRRVPEPLAVGRDAWCHIASFVEDERTLSALNCVSAAMHHAISPAIAKHQSQWGRSLTRQYCCRSLQTSQRAIIMSPLRTSIACGYAGDQFPSLFTEAEIAADDADPNNLLVDRCATRSAHISRPMNCGVVLDWDQYEVLLDYSLARLQAPEDFLLEYTDAPLQANVSRLKMTQIVFETLNAGGFHTISDAAAACYGSVKTTALVVDLWGQRVSAVYEGYALPATCMNIENARVNNVALFVDEVLKAVKLSLAQCDPEIRKDFLKSFVVTGGESLEVTQMIRDAITANIAGAVEPAVAETDYSSWLGGSILASLSTFKGMWITKDEYDECGPAIALRKCF